MRYKQPVAFDLVSNCAGARESAHKGLALDQSIATVPNATLALAFCGESASSLKEIEGAAGAEPTNTLYTDLALPEVKAAAALAQHHPEEVAKLLAPVYSIPTYLLVSKAAHIAGLASLEAKKPQQAVTDFEPGIRYHWVALGEGGTGASQAPDYGLCLLGTARAQAQFDKTAATRSYQQLLEVWKSADADFVPAKEAHRELAALSGQAKN